MKNVDEVAKSIDCEEESKYVVKITVYIHGVKDTVAERLEAHEFCSTARRVSCWFESHQQQSTFFLFFLFLFFSFQFFESSFFTLHLFSFFSHSTVFEKTRNLNRIPKYTFVGEGGDVVKIKIRSEKKHVNFYFPQNHCKCSTNYCQMLFLGYPKLGYLIKIKDFYNMCRFWR